MNILIVEDNNALADAISDYLSLNGYTSTHLRKIDGALEAMLSTEHVLFLMDIDLPDGSGLDLLKVYRDAGGRTPVIMMTGHRELEDKETGLELGADDYITKPFELRELFARIKAILRRSNEYSASPAALLKRDGVLNGRYKLIKEIDEGGMAKIWLAQDNDAERLVVIKIMKEDFVEGTNAAKRFDTEVKLMARINHPNVATLYDVGFLTPEHPYLVMEYIRGESLRDTLSREGKLPPELVLEIVAQICSGLQEAHDAGVVHRDLKPENLLIQGKKGTLEKVKIVDFGIARDFEANETRLTKTGMIVGTLDYLSPEQLTDVPVDGRADIYTLGIIAYELLTGDVPFAARTPQALVAKHLTQDPFPPSWHDPSFKPLDELIKKAMQKRPANRFQSAQEMKDECSEILQSLESGV